MTPRQFNRPSRRGYVAVVAMMFLTLLATLSVAMYATATMNVQISRNYSEQQHARSIAESGLRWMSWRFTHMARPKTTIGNITPTVATALWPSIRTAIINDFATLTNAAERPLVWNGTTLTSASIAADETKGRFTLSMRLNPSDPRYIIVNSTATAAGAKHTVSMEFKIDKK